MRRVHRANHDHVNRHHLFTLNTTATASKISIDGCDSSLNDMKEHTGLSATRLLNIANHLTKNGDGTGTSHGVMLDGVDSSLNDMKVHTGLSATRLLNIANHLTQNGDGTGTSAGVMLDGVDSSLNTIESNSTLQASRLNLIATDIADVETLLTTQATHNTTTLALNNYLGSANNLMSSVSCVAAGQLSSVVDWGATRCPKRVQVIAVGNSSTSGSGVEIHGSHDNTTWCPITIGTSKTITISSTESDGTVLNSSAGVVTDWCMRYIRIKVFCLSTFNATVIGSI